MRRRIGTASNSGRSDLAADLELLGVDEPKGGQRLECRVQVRDLLAHELELVGRLIFREHLARTIQDEAAIRRDRLDARAVALRKLQVVVMAHDLQLRELTSTATTSTAMSTPAHAMRRRKSRCSQVGVLDAYRG